MTRPFRVSREEDSNSVIFIVLRVYNIVSENPHPLVMKTTLWTRGCQIRAGVKKGDLILILGASGGVGLAAVQLAKAAGATVVAAASTSEKLRVCRDSGADLLLNYREGEGDWRGALKRLTEGRGIDVVVDIVGGSDCGVRNSCSTRTSYLEVCTSLSIAASCELWESVQFLTKNLFFH